jgi:hypothetical protein
MTTFRVAQAAAAGLIAIALIRTSAAPAAQPELHPRPARVGAGAIDGSAVLAPAQFPAGRAGVFELRVTLAGDGLPTGGRLLVGFPKAWFVNPFPIPKRLQTADRAKPHFLAVAGSRPGAVFAITIDTTGFSGKVERFNQTVEAVNTGVSLVKGDLITLTLANTSAPYIAGTDVVRVAVAAGPSAPYAPMRAAATYDVMAGAPEDFTLVAPTEAVAGRALTLQLTAFDGFWNVAPKFAGRIQITGVDRPRTIELSPADRGQKLIAWTPAKEGFYFPEATVRIGGTATSPLMVRGNPIRVTATEPALKTYWGEMHSHSSISADGIGHDPFPYARDAAHLDFFAATEHADDDGNPKGDAIRPEEWQWITDRVRQMNEPGRFVTLLAYESSFPAPYGHHNVFFRAIDGVVWPSAVTGSVQNLWSHIAAGEAITIPHHTGIAFFGAPAEASRAGPELQPIVTAPVPATFPPGAAVDWSIHDPVRRPLLEIYSLHGSSEFYDPTDPLSYESLRFTFARSVPGPHYARDAWAAGLELGVIAATDNHSAQPGQPQGGIAAVRAPRLTRDAVFDALSAKATYATTGQRLYLDFDVAGVRMGESGAALGPIAGRVTIAAPSAIARAEVLRRDSPSGDYVVAAHWDGPGRLLQTTFTDTPRSTRTMYYLRVELTEKVRGRVVRAWSSPVWLHAAAAE